MKLSILLFAGVAFSATIFRQPNSESSYGLERRQWSKLSDFILMFFGPGGKVPDPPGAAPRKVVLESPIKLPGAQRVKIRSGPYSVPNMGKASSSGHLGMMENTPDYHVEKPCEECVLLMQTTGLEYANGTNANIDTGLWLHHMVHFVEGPNRWDPTGQQQFCLPHLGVRTTPAKSERLFTAGNERTTLNYNARGTGMEYGSGYQVEKADKFSYLVELMNMNMEDAVVYITMVYDFLPGKLPPGWDETKSIWLDVLNCWNSEVEPPAEKGKFTLSSKPWTANIGGTIVDVMGHVHDGGTEVEFGELNKTMCKTQTQYAERTEYVYRGASMGSDKVARDHISSMTPGCRVKNIASSEVKVGSKWVIKGHYDYDRYEGNLEHGKQSLIMTLGIIVIAIPPGSAPRPPPPV